MGGLRRAFEIIYFFVFFPLGCFFLVSLAMAVGVKTFLIFVGTLIVILTGPTFGMAMLFGVLKPSELVDRIGNGLHSSKYFEGARLPRTASDPEPTPFAPE